MNRQGSMSTADIQKSWPECYEGLRRRRPDADVARTLLEDELRAANGEALPRGDGGGARGAREIQSPRDSIQRAHSEPASKVTRARDRKHRRRRGRAYSHIPSVRIKKEVVGGAGGADDEVAGVRGDGAAEGGGRCGVEGAGARDGERAIDGERAAVGEREEWLRRS